MAIGIIRVRAWGYPQERDPAPGGRVLFNSQMKTDVWALVGIVVTTIQIQQVTH
jgi:hypothetical protein